MKIGLLALIIAALHHPVTLVRASTPSGCAPVPVAHVRPTHGPVGTRIHFRGHCFHRDSLSGGYGVFILADFAKPRECELLAGRDQRFSINAVGHLRGSFVVARRGHCFQHEYGRRVTPALYSVNFGCHACPLAEFRVTRR